MDARRAVSGVSMGGVAPHHLGHVVTTVMRVVMKVVRTRWVRVVSPEWCQTFTYTTYSKSKPVSPTVPEDCSAGLGKQVV